MQKTFPENFAKLSEEVDQLKSKSGKAKMRILSADWIFESAEAGELLVEQKFVMKAVHSNNKREKRALEQRKEKEALEQDALIKSMSASLPLN